MQVDASSVWQLEAAERGILRHAVGCHSKRHHPGKFAQIERRDPAIWGLQDGQPLDRQIGPWAAA
jgi:hypothetical protein